MNGLACDIEFMLRYPYLFTAIMLVFIPCMTLIAAKLFDLLKDRLRKGDD